MSDIGFYGATGSQGPPGETGPAGPQGPAGSRGSRIYTGEGDPDIIDPGDWVPDGASSAAGDLYIDTTNNDLYIL
jgi:hypothetical protein